MKILETRKYIFIKVTNRTTRNGGKIKKKKKGQKDEYSLSV